MKIDYYRVIRILQVEGNDRHAERVRLHLYASGLRCAIRRVASREDYVEALRQFWPDVVVAGGDLPTLDVSTALQIAGEQSPYLPIVFAVLDHLSGLSQVVLGALMQAREVRGRRVAEMSDRRIERDRRQNGGERTTASLAATGTGGPYSVH